MLNCPPVSLEAQGRRVAKAALIVARKASGQNYGLLSMNFGLHYVTLASDFGLLGFLDS